MKKNYHYSRKYRQLKYAVKQLKNTNSSNTTFTKQLILKIKRLLNELKVVMATYRLKRLVAPALLVLGTALQNPVAAQDFTGPTQNPFGIISITPLVTAHELVDLDADGDLDLFTGGLADGELSAFYFQENIGSSAEPTFDRLYANPFGLNVVPESGSFYPSFGDVDADGDLDLITGSYLGIIYYENIGTAQRPEFGTPELNPFNLNVAGLDRTVFPELVDFDNDEDLDILLSDVAGDYFYCQNIGNNSTPNFDISQSTPFGLRSNDNITFLRTVDIDDDADLDVIAGSQSYYNNIEGVFGAEIYYYKNIGDVSAPNFEGVDSVLLDADVLRNFAMPAMGDLDADGDLDLLASQFQATTFYYENEGNNTTPLFNSKSEGDFGIHQYEFQLGVASNINYLTVPELVDLDADGDLDLIYGGANYIYNYITGIDSLYGRLKFYENIGTAISPEFALPTKAPFEIVDTYTTANPSFTDIDDDGDLDLFVTEYYGKVTFYENTGNAQTPVFANQLENPFGLVFEDYEISKLIFADMDNDGDEDCFNNQYNKTVYFENTSTNGEISFQNKGNNFNIALPEILVEETIFQDVTDIDNDGDYDLFIFSYDPTQLFYFENIGTAQNATFAEAIAIPIGTSSFSDDYLLFPVFVDLDADGDQDLMFGSTINGAVFYYENNDSLPVNIIQNKPLNISIYPNPANDVLYISNFETVEKVEILNTVGQMVQQVNQPQNNISLNGLPAATYFVKITDKKGAQAVQKLHKQ